MIINLGVFISGIEKIQSGNESSLNKSEITAMSKFKLDTVVLESKYNAPKSFLKEQMKDQLSWNLSIII